MASRWVLAFYPVLLSKRQRRFDVLLAQTILEFYLRIVRVGAVSDHTPAVIVVEINGGDEGTVGEQPAAKLQPVRVRGDELRCHALCQ